MSQKKICVLYSGVGAGHKAVANSILYYLKQRSDLNVSSCDFNKDFKINVFGKSSELYRLRS